MTLKVVDESLMLYSFTGFNPLSVCYGEEDDSVDDTFICSQRNNQNKD